MTHIQLHLSSVTLLREEIFLSLKVQKSSDFDQISFTRRFLVPWVWAAEKASYWISGCSLPLLVIQTIYYLFLSSIRRTLWRGCSSDLRSLTACLIIWRITSSNLTFLEILFSELEFLHLSSKRQLSLNLLSNRMRFDEIL